MNKFLVTRSLSAIALIGWALFGGQALASQEEPSVPALDLSSDVEGPGFEVTLTLRLSVPEGIGIGNAVSEITYQNKILEFLGVTRGLSAEAAGAKVTAVTEESGSDISVVRVTIAAREGQRIPQGIMADLRFKVSEEAPADETTFPLINNVSAFSDGIPPVAIDSITGEDGAVTVTATPPQIACFFYMH